MIESARCEMMVKANLCRYNGLPEDYDQPQVSQEHLAHLAKLFTSNNADGILGIHLIHGHFKIPEGSVLLGSNFSNPAIRWARVVEISKIDLADMHGHVFVLSENQFCPYEFQDGPLPDLTGIKPEFLPEFLKYIMENNLTSVVGLQVLSCNEASMSELILDQGTVMLDSSVVRNTEPTRVTGWHFENQDGNPRTCTASETHSKMTSGNHKVFNAGKPLPKLENIEDLKSALTDAGVL